MGAKDATTLQTTIATIQAKYAELVKSGNLEEAKVYASKVQKFINSNAEKIKNVAAGNTTIAALIDGIKKLPTSATTTAKEAAAAVKSDASNITNTAAGSVKGTTTNAVNDVKQKATDKANETIDKTNKKANEAVEKAKKKASEAVGNATDKAIKGLGL